MNEVTINGPDTSKMISQLLKPSTSGKAQFKDNSFYDLMGSILNMFAGYQSIPVLQKNQQDTEDSTNIQSPLLSNLFSHADLKERSPVVHFDIGRLFAGLSGDQILSGLKGYDEQCLISEDDQQVLPDLLNNKKDAKADLTVKPPVVHFDIGKLFAGLSAEGADSETQESLLKNLIAQMSSIGSQMQSNKVLPNKMGNSSKADFVQTFSLTREPDASVSHHIQATGNGNEPTPADTKSDLFAMQPKIAKSISYCDIRSLLPESFVELAQNEMSFHGETSAQGEQIKNMEHDQSGKPLEIVGSLAGVLSSPENVTNQDSAKIVHPATETPETNRLFRDTLIITKRDGATIEVSLEPDGLGKLDIHLSLDRGLVNARIGVSETVGRELFERNIYSIVNALHNEGINIGSFSVHLKDKGKEFKDEGKNMKVFCVTNENKHLFVNSVNNHIVSIFV